MQISFGYYPGGKKKALTTSYDDGSFQDRQLVEIFNQYGIRGSFHLNSNRFDSEQGLASAEIKELFAGHEVSAHTVNHPYLTQVPMGVLVEEIMEDRRRLEQLVGYPVRGMSYPYGAYDDAVLKALPFVGIEYSRTTLSHGRFNLPENFLTWHPTCHHNQNAIEKYKEFLAVDPRVTMPLFYLWGHSYEFDIQNNWELIKDFCKLAGNDENIWYATNIEIVDYLKAMRKLVFSVDKKVVINNSALSIWINVDYKPIEIKPGITKL